MRSSRFESPGGREGDGDPGFARPDWAWAPYAPDADRPWTRALAGHLWRRAAFGATWPELERSIAEGPAKSIDRLLSPEADVAAFQASQDDLSDGAARAGSAEGVAAWWLRRMIGTPHPLLEKLTLFWRGHFAASNARVKAAGLIERQVRMLRRNALGRFDAMLEDVSRDPATLVALDGAANRKARPSVAYARSLLEVLTVGPGEYSERDVGEVARAFTGWFVLSGELRDIPRERDTGVKRIFGREGAFGSAEAVRILLEQPATSRNVVRKLYRLLISETAEPSDAQIEPLVDDFSRTHALDELVGRMLRSNLFFSPAAYRQRVKSPVELAVGLVRSLEGMVGTLQLARDVAELGQDLCEPPTVEGWAGGTSWIHRQTMIGRARLAHDLLVGPGAHERPLDVPGTVRKHGADSPEAASRLFLDLLLDGDGRPEPSSPGGPDAAIRHAALRVATLPEFQLS